MSLARKLPWLPIAATAGFGVLCAALSRAADPAPAWAMLAVAFVLAGSAAVMKRWAS